MVFALDSTIVNGSIVRFGPAAAGFSRIILQQPAANYANFSAYMTPSEVNQTLSSIPFAFPGVGALRLDANRARLTTPTRTSTFALDWGDGFTDGRLLGQQGGIIYAAAFGRALSDSETTRVLAWLAQRYQIPM